MIHQTAIIHPKAALDPTARVEPCAVIDEGVTVGPRCVIGPHVHLTGQTTIGADNRFHSGCVIGDAPQDMKYQGAPTRLRIGDHNVFREHVTVHRSNQPEEDTVVGSHNVLMAHSHVGHNSLVGDHVVLANGALLGGHVTVEDRAFISAYCLIHQFCRVGALSMMQGYAGISLDLPPFCVARGKNGICGLNTVGLRRAGLGAAERTELKRLYHFLFRSRRLFRDVLAEAQREFQSEACVKLIEFVVASKRGVVHDKGQDSIEA